MGKPPNSPYPPDLVEDAVLVTDLEDLVDAVVVDRDWANRPARGLVARRVELRRCRLTGVELAEAMLSDVAFDDCRLDLAGLRIAKLERVVFRECRMAECDFYDASLTDVLFEDCELREATFSGVKLKRVELRGCDLSGLRGVEAPVCPGTTSLRTARCSQRHSGSRSSTNGRGTFPHAGAGKCLRATGVRARRLLVPQRGNCVWRQGRQLDGGDTNHE